jgi:hypothetical protein
MSSILKTGSLIRTITRRAFIPSSQETFTDEDFLEMATEEINLGLVPLIQRMHEEHLIYFTDIPVDTEVLRYPIPARAHGNKLRDVALIDENGNVFEMYRYSLSEISDFSSSTAYIRNRGFYLENNDIVLTNFETNIGQKIRMYFYMRPNSLVMEDKGATIEQTTSLFEVDAITPLSGSITSIAIGAAATITSASHGLSSGQTVSISGSDSTPSIDGVYEITYVDTNTFTIPVTVSVAGVSGGWTLMRQCIKLSLSQIPTQFLTEDRFDFVQYISPNKILHYDIIPNSIDQNTSSISFTSTDISNVQIGDYITSAEETIVPNIPTELHPILAQRVAVACLEAMGDEPNKQSAERKLAAMEKDAGTFLDNRVEGANQKIKSRHSPLVSTLSPLGRRNRRW